MPAATIYTLGLHETLKLDRYTSVMRVEGGWIYTMFTGGEAMNFKPVGSVFVPIGTEFE